MTNDSAPHRRPTDHHDPTVAETRAARPLRTRGESPPDAPPHDDAPVPPRSSGAPRQQRRGCTFSLIAGGVFTAITVIATVIGLATDVLSLSGIFSPGGISKAQPGETLVIVADFAEQGVEADTRIYRALVERVEESALEDVRVERLEGQMPITSGEAQALGEAYSASLVIWGTADSLGMEPHYEIIGEASERLRRAEPGTIVAVEQPNYSAYVLETAPQEFEYVLLLTLGQLAYDHADFETAFTLSSEAVSFDFTPERAAALSVETAWVIRGLAQSALGDPEAAIEDYNMAISLRPDYSSAYANRGIAYAILGDTDRALEEYDRATEIDPSNPIPYTNRGYLYAFQFDEDRALAEFEAALELDPNYPSAIIGRADILFERGETERAMDEYTRAVEVAPSYGYAYFSRGRAYAFLDQYNRAIGNYNEWIELEPNNYEAYSWRSGSYLALGRPRRALEDANTALDLNPEYAPAYLDRAQAHVAMGNPDLAYPDYERAIALVPDFPGTYYARALTYDINNRPAEAVEDYQRFLDLWFEQGRPPDQATDHAQQRIEELGGN